MYLHTKMKFLGQGFQKLEHEGDRLTDVTESITGAAFKGCNKVTFCVLNELELTVCGIEFLWLFALKADCI